MELSSLNQENQIRIWVSEYEMRVISRINCPLTINQRSVLTQIVQRFVAQSPYEYVSD